MIQKLSGIVLTRELPQNSSRQVDLTTFYSTFLRRKLSLAGDNRSPGDRDIHVWYVHRERYIDHRELKIGLCITLQRMLSVYKPNRIVRSLVQGNRHCATIL